MEGDSLWCIIPYPWCASLTHKIFPFIYGSIPYKLSQRTIGSQTFTTKGALQHIVLEYIVTIRAYNRKLKETRQYDPRVGSTVAPDLTTLPMLSMSAADTSPNHLPHNTRDSTKDANQIMAQWHRDVEKVCKWLYGKSHVVAHDCFCSACFVLFRKPSRFLALQIDFDKDRQTKNGKVINIIRPKEETHLWKSNHAGQWIDGQSFLHSKKLLAVQR